MATVTRPIGINTFRSPAVYKTILTVNTTPQDIPYTALTGNFSISLVGASSGPQAIFFMSKSQSSVAGDVLETSQAPDASLNRYTITYNASAKPQISCTASISTTITIYPL